MRGKILWFNTEKGYGCIEGEDNESYFFRISNVSNSGDIRENYSVKFSPKKNQKGLTAFDIKVYTPLASGSRDRMLKIQDIRIRASEIKEYELKKYTSFTSQDDDGNVSYKLYKKKDEWLRTVPLGTYEYEYLGEHLDKFLLECKTSDEYYYRPCLKDKFGDYYEVNVDGFTFYKDPKNDDIYMAKIEENVCHNQYEIAIKTYTSGEKTISCGADIKEANELLDYLDDELNKLL